MSEPLGQQLDQLSVFAGLYKDPVFSLFVKMAQAPRDSREAAKAAAAFAAALYERDLYCWSDYLLEKVLTLDTCAARRASREKELPKLMLDAAMNELDVLSRAAGMRREDFSQESRLAAWTVRKVDMQAEYLNRLMEIDVYGFGRFCSSGMYRMRASRKGKMKIRPVNNPDPVTFDMLYGYQSQHEALLENTAALAQGLPASNVLLYGAAGTGKSASVKAACNALYKQGVRLVEVGRDDLHLLPELMDLLADQPMKFIIFIDDLSFMENDDGFSALKAVLEGSVSARSTNTAIYATSNRRHLVKESSAARTSEELFKTDGMQETISLSERFGLKLYFDKPKEEEYLNLVSQVAREKKLKADSQMLDQARQYALSKGGRSPRAARQFVEMELWKGNRK